VGRNAAGRGGGGRGAFTSALVNLTTTLADLPPERCEIVTAPDPRPRTFAVELQRALAAAHWTCTLAGDAPAEVPAFVVQVPRASRPATALVNWGRRLGFEPVYRVMPRLNQIRIAVGVLRDR
jgi:hypothetical protein